MHALFVRSSQTVLLETVRGLIPCLAEWLQEHASRSELNQRKRDLGCRRLKRSSCRCTGLALTRPVDGGGAGTLVSELPQRSQSSMMRWVDAQSAT